MALPKRFDCGNEEKEIQQMWEERGIYSFQRDSNREVYAIDTPPPTVSGHLHMGHVFSYCQTDFMARFHRMRGHNVFYPMGFDDNGLPTERLVEKTMAIKASDVGREEFVHRCLEISEKAERQYETLWRRLGLSVDWNYAYRTISEESRRTSQNSFIDLYRKGKIYRKKQPNTHCPECKTAIAQAELNDQNRKSDFTTIAFSLGNGEILPIATTRPELLSACVAIFVHPEDGRFQSLSGTQAQVPLYGHWVPVLTDAMVEPEKGTGVVMCCTFGDATDVEWWHMHNLPLKEAIGRDGKMTELSGPIAGLPIQKARKGIIKILAEQGLVLKTEPVEQSVRVHERCDTPVEYHVAEQWFIQILDMKPELLEAGNCIKWHPAHMRLRYKEWVENLGWDWCISRQRVFGVPFPVWFCEKCGEVLLANEKDLPVDPTIDNPSQICRCGSKSFVAETDVMDTWATSSLTPQIAGQWMSNESLFQKVFPMTLRPQAHDIIRTWTFYTIVKSLLHSGKIPWQNVAISGWGLAPSASKLSKSRESAEVKSPEMMLSAYSADAIRYWSACTGFGKDALISEEKIQAGEKLVTKLWNVARFCEPFIAGYHPLEAIPTRTPADCWILSRLQKLISRATELFVAYDYVGARAETEDFFWNDFCGNYIEMAKKRLYEGTEPAKEGARFALFHSLLTILKLLAPFLPYVTEKIYQEIYDCEGDPDSIHQTAWPEPNPLLMNEEGERAGALILEIASFVRRYKSEHNLPLRTELDQFRIAAKDAQIRALITNAEADIISVTRARKVVVENDCLAMETVNLSELGCGFSIVP